MDILIIEDESKTAKELKMMVEGLGVDLNVIGIIASVKAGIKWLQEHAAPQLILSDIQLSDGLSFEIFRSVEIGCPVIFCTAFDTYAIQAFEANGIDYLLKPIDEMKLAKSLNKYEQMRHMMTLGAVALPRITDQLRSLIAQMTPKYKQSLLVFKNEKIIPIKTADIAFIHSEKGLVNVYTKMKQIYLIREVLDELSPLLDPQRFFRANRQFIINRDVLVMAEHYFNRRIFVKLNIETPESIIVSKIRAPMLLEWMNQ
jgi:Response regulator of the LytR/AlgR family